MIKLHTPNGYYIEAEKVSEVSEVIEVIRELSQVNMTVEIISEEEEGFVTCPKCDYEEIDNETETVTLGSRAVMLKCIDCGHVFAL